MNERTTKTTLANIINNNGKNLEQTTATTRKKLVKVIQGKYIISTRLIGKSLPHFSHLYSSAKKKKKTEKIVTRIPTHWQENIKSSYLFYFY